MPEQAYHVIEIKVPVPPNSSAGAFAVMTAYLAEVEALRAKLPDGSLYSDHVSKPRDETKPRKSLRERIDEAVEADRKARGGPRHAAAA